jgi:hypothetical protein
MSSETTRGKWQVISGSWLKLLAMATMLVDHLAAFYLCNDSRFLEPLFMIGHKYVSVYALLRIMGRLSFPIFAFLVVEGFLHTHDRRKYGRNLFLFALLSELPWNLVHTGTWHCTSQNVLFTLLAGYLGLCAIERFRRDRRKLALSLIGLLALTVLLRADYGCSGYGFILLLYVLRRQPLLQAVIGSCVLGSRWIAGLAFIPINMYNGQRGFIRGPFAKYLFYLFYPLHLFVIYWLLRAR